MSDLETAVRESAGDFREFLYGVLVMLALFGPVMFALFCTLAIVSATDQFIMVLPVGVLWIVALFVTDVAFKYFDGD